MIAEFFGWMELLRQKIVFVTGTEIAEPLNALFDSIRFQFTGETALQGVIPPKEVEKVSAEAFSQAYDVHATVMQLYIGE